MDAALLDGPAQSTPPTLAIVIVNFNSWPDSERLVASLAASDATIAGRCEVILVDNASDDLPPLGLDTLPGVRVIRRPDNAGFAAGVNTAWRLTSARWLLLLNPDVVAEADLASRVLGRIASFEGRPSGAPGVVGFALRNADGSRQHSVGPFPTLAGCVREVLTPRSRRKYWPLDRTRPGPVPWVTGACMLVRAALLEEIGGMDEDYFLYHEEVALCRSARDRGWIVEYDDSVKVTHLRPLQSRGVSPRLRVVTRHSKLLYFLTFRPRWEHATLARIVAAEAFLRRIGCRLVGRSVEARAWEAVGRIARRLGPGQGPRGVEVLAIAETAVRGANGGIGGGTAPGTHAARLRRPIALDRSRR